MFVSRAVVLALIACCPAVGLSQTPPTAPPTQTPPADGAAAAQPPRRGPRPYTQVITTKAVTERGGITVHRVDDRYFFEVPDSVMSRDFLMVTRVSGAPSGSGGFQTAGTSINERMIRWERVNERLLVKSISTDALHQLRMCEEDRTSDHDAYG